MGEVRELLERGHWPQACRDELRAHVAACRVCGDMVLLTQAFRREKAVAASQAKLEPAGAVWWRAQLRRRNAAIERVSKPILGAQIFALITILVALAVMVAIQARQGLAWIKGLAIEWLSPDMAAGFSANIWIVIPAAATLAMLGGVVVYLVWWERQPR
jgi:hypothetical protein